MQRPDDVPQSRTQCRWSGFRVSRSDGRKPLCDAVSGCDQEVPGATRRIADCQGEDGALGIVGPLRLVEERVEGASRSVEMSVVGV